MRNHSEHMHQEVHADGGLTIGTWWELAGKQDTTVRVPPVHRDSLGASGKSNRDRQPGPFALALLAVLMLACRYEPCVPVELGKEPPAGEAGLYAWWTDNAFPLRLVVDTTHGCPLEVVRAAAKFWEGPSGGFEVVEGRWRGGKDRDYAHVYVRTGEPKCPGLVSCSGHTQLAAIAPGRAMYASITVDERCDLAVLTHELGHALGLDEADRRGAVMEPREAMDGWELSESEADRLAYACAEGDTR